MIKLITIDIDGTLVTPSKRLTRDNIESIKKAKDMGVTITLASGRPYPGMREYIEALEIVDDNDYTIAQNGSFIHKNSTGEVIDGVFNSRDNLEFIEDIITPFGLELSYMDADKFYTRHRFPSIYTLMNAFVGKRKLIRKQYSDFLDTHEFGRFLAMGPSSRVNKFFNNMPEEITANFYAVKTSPYQIEIMNKGTNKGVAVAKLASYLDIGPENIMAIGNELNDIPMIEYAGIGVAMENANEELKKRADFITRSNRHSGVSYVINRLIENNLEKI